MEKKKIILIAISVVAVVLVSTIVLMQVFMKKNVIDQVSQSQEKATPKALDVSSWESSKVTVYTDKSGKVAPIPVGYVASNVTGETEIDTGLVIYEGTEPVIKPDSETGDVPETEIGVPGTDAWIASCNRNQWVWVPVDNVNRIYDKETRKSKLYNIQKTGRSESSNTDKEPAVSKYDIESHFSQSNLPGMTRKKLLYEIDTELVETIKSIEKYGGFYIGRYETGDVTSINPVVKRMNEKISSAVWYDAYVNLRTLGANDSVKANMIYGCLWDETLQWFRETNAVGENEEETAANLYNSGSWGNHSDSESFTYYKNVSGESATKTQGEATRTPTGATERNKANNIYDMAGNVWEWTMECFRSISSERIYCSGCYSYESAYSVDASGTGIRPDQGYFLIGVRAYLYIK